jgi:hypothetical protein
MSRGSAAVPFVLARRIITIKISKSFVQALALGLALCGCKKKEEPTKLE